MWNPHGFNRERNIYPYIQLCMYVCIYVSIHPSIYWNNIYLFLVPATGITVSRNPEGYLSLNLWDAVSVTESLLVCDFLGGRDHISSHGYVLTNYLVPELWKVLDIFCYWNGMKIELQTHGLYLFQHTNNTEVLDIFQRPISYRPSISFNLLMWSRKVRVSHSGFLGDTRMVDVNGRNSWEWKL